MCQPRMSFQDLLLLSGDADRNTSPLFTGGRIPTMAEATAPGLHSPSSLYKDGRGFGLCTESLGSESSSDGSVVDGEETPWMTMEDEAVVEKRGRSKGETLRGGKREFPPPLPSLALHGDGRNCTRHAFMKAVRQDGRLTLTPVTIESTPVFHACRSDGRLRLLLISQPCAEEDITRFEEEEEEQAEEDMHMQAMGEEQVEAETSLMAPLPWVVGDGSYNRRCHEIPTVAVASPTPFPFFGNNPRLMTTA